MSQCLHTIGLFAIEISREGNRYRYKEEGFKGWGKHFYIVVITGPIVPKIPEQKFARISFFKGGCGLSRGVFFNCYEQGLLKRVLISRSSCKDMLGALG
jgi:hypothetical protein